MAELLLQQRYRATDAEAASDAIRAVLGAGTVTAAHGEALEYVQQSLVDDGVSVTLLRSAGAGVEVRAATVPDLVVLAVRDGALELRQDGGSVVLARGDLALICLGGDAELHWDRVEVDVYSFPPASVARLLGTDHQRMRLRCARTTPKSATMAAFWHRQAAALGGDVLQNRELFNSDVIREQAIESLLAVTVEAFGISEAAEDDDTSDEGRAAAAEAYMRQRLKEPITIPEIASAAGLSLRGLELLFQRCGKGTPLLHLRQLRMEAAREALLAASTRPVTVGAVARSLSYTNVGRFSAHYREAFGDSPAGTLRAARADGA